MEKATRGCKHVYGEVPVLRLPRFAVGFEIDEPPHRLWQFSPGCIFWRARRSAQLPALSVVVNQAGQRPGSARAQQRAAELGECLLRLAVQDVRDAVIEKEVGVV